MCKLVLDGGSVSSFTSVSNVFIDEYMNKANGEFVKIYLYLLRMVSKIMDAPEEFSTEKIADHFGILESDVYRALTYWNDEEVLSLSFNDEGKIEGVLLNNYIQTKAASSRILHQDESVDVNLLAKASGESVSVPATSSKEYIIPVKKKRSASEITKFAEDGTVKELCFLAEQYLSITLSPAATNSIIYMVEDLKLDSDLIEHLLESGETSLSKIEKKAVAYAKAGITTLEDAKQDEMFRDKISKAIYKVFGEESPAPVKREIDFISKWHNEFKFSDEIIIEACHRTMAHTHKGSFEYTDSILTNWYNKGALSMEAIEKLDDEHSKKQSSKFAKTSKKASKKKKIESHTYDFKELEKKLAQSNKKKD